MSTDERGPGNEAHDLIMSVFGGMPKGERNRIKVRAPAAMASQVLMEGRYFGGRPRTDTGWSISARTPIPPRPRTANTCTASNPTQTPPRSFRIFTEFRIGLGVHTGADPALVTQWISETQARRARAEAELRTASKGPGARMSRDEIARLVRSISDLAAVVQQAEVEDKAEIYRQLGLRLTYVPAQATVRAEVTLDPNNDKSPRSTSNRGDLVRVRGGT